MDGCVYIQLSVVCIRPHLGCQNGQHLHCLNKQSNSKKHIFTPQTQWGCVPVNPSSPPSHVPGHKDDILIGQLLTGHMLFTRQLDDIFYRMTSLNEFLGA